MTSNRLLASTLLSGLILQGCAQQPVITTSVEIEAPLAASKTQPEANMIPFETDTLYALLVAEFAGSRERYDIALGNYVQQAHLTHDIGITARATRIASFLNEHNIALETALLWLDLEPTNNEARMIAANGLSRSGRLLEAFEHSIALHDNGSKSIYQTLAARAAKSTDIERELLLEKFNERLALHPNNISLLVGKGLLLQQQGHLKPALASAKSALLIEPENIAAAILEANLLGLLKKPEEALHRLITLLDQHPDNNRVRLQYARLLASQDLSKAREQFRMLVESSPRDPDLRFSLALVSNELGDMAAAKKHFEALLDMGQRRSSAHYYLGRIAETEQQRDVALGHYLAVTPGPDYMSSVLRSTDLFIRGQEISRANQHLSNIRQRFPSQAERLYMLESELLIKHKYLDQAERVLTAALAERPSSSNLLYARAMLNERRNMLELSELDLRSIIKYDPNNATALNALGYTLADRTDRYQEAYQLISQALNLRPDDPAVIDSMGWVQYRLGNLEEAILRLRQAMKAFPDHEIAAHLGEVLWKSGNTQGARTVWAEGLSLEPNSKVIPATIKRLESELVDAQ